MPLDRATAAICLPTAFAASTFPADFRPAFELRRQRTGRREHVARHVVNDLGINLGEAALHGQPRPFGRPGDSLPDPPRPARQGESFSCRSFHGLRLPPSDAIADCGMRNSPFGPGDSAFRTPQSQIILCAGADERLAGLAANDFGRVLDALALIRLGRLHAAHARGELADVVLVGCPRSPCDPGSWPA